MALIVDDALERRGFRCKSLRMWLMVRWRDRARYLLSALVGPEQELARLRAPANGIRVAIRLPLRVWATAWFATQMGAYQLWLYLSAGLSLLSPTGRRQLAFWHRGAPGPSNSLSDARITAFSGLDVPDKEVVPELSRRLHRPDHILAAPIT